MKEDNNWTLPTFARVGIAGVVCFLLLFLLGAIPGVNSPIWAISQQLKEHADQSDHMSIILRAMCREIAEQKGRAIPSECR